MIHITTNIMTLNRLTVTLVIVGMGWGCSGGQAPDNTMAGSGLGAGPAKDNSASSALVITVELPSLTDQINAAVGDGGSAAIPSHDGIPTANLKSAQESAQALGLPSCGIFWKALNAKGEVVAKQLLNTTVGEPTLLELTIQDLQATNAANMLSFAMVYDDCDNLISHELLMLLSFKLNDEVSTVVNFNLWKSSEKLMKLGMISQLMTDSKKIPMALLKTSLQQYLDFSSLNDLDVHSNIVHHLLAVTNRTYVDLNSQEKLAVFVTQLNEYGFPVTSDEASDVSEIGFLVDNELISEQGVMMSSVDLGGFHVVVDLLRIICEVKLEAGADLTGAGVESKGVGFSSVNGVTSNVQHIYYSMSNPVKQSNQCNFVDSGAFYGTGQGQSTPLH